MFSLQPLAGWSLPSLPDQQIRNILLRFYKKIKPDAVGWKPVIQKGLDAAQLSMGDISSGTLTSGIAAMVFATFMVYALLFGTGYFLYGQLSAGYLAAGVAIVCGFVLRRLWPRLGFDNKEE